MRVGTKAARVADLRIDNAAASADEAETRGAGAPLDQKDGPVATGRGPRQRTR